MIKLSKEDRKRLRELLESSCSPEEKCKLSNDEIKKEIIKEKQKIDKEQMKVQK